ncbi:hypothetical protein M409DRAFT_54610 [Zasmidium cellare ATCC 36951]|uniref:PHD-type domain-containing protein n=1 Tax=Zasmidium cellare ATCC 36951 TaxID=1080233 RepID=A0A6A6CKZ4_ZASCE|nr:uncharacterized protein M409DRAFT_54610 [Zasmidium cellare ATCC 36951]KAF2166830.1 hypothetical protein M409DRAFT_54610 [Zasmidium cellare ATCC 36951]
MPPGEDFGSPRRTQDLFKRIPQQRPENNARSPSPDQFRILGTVERRKQDQLLRDQPPLHNHWEPRESRSPAARRKERRHRPSSPARRDTSRSGEWHLPRNEPRSPHEEPYYSTSMKGPNVTTYRNLSWTNPNSSVGQPVKPRVSEKAPPAGSDSASRVGKAEVNGIKDVPTGPAMKGGNAPVPQSILQLPHIFISSESVPASQSTVPHLATLVRRCGPVDVVCDDTGYYIAFANSREGRSNMNKCEKAYKGEPFFGMYCLTFQPFPFGQQQGEHAEDRRSPTTVATTAAEASTQTAVQHHPPASDKIQMVLEALAPEREDGVAGISRTAMQVPPERPVGSSNLLEKGAGLPTSHSVQSRPDTRPQSTTEPLRTSPPRPTSPLDSTSSISGRTGSDISAMGPRRCHVCKARSEVDSLVKCTTCVRRYHRYCYTGRSIPAFPGDHWQCKRCERKKIPLHRSQPGGVGTSADGEAAVPSDTARESSPPKAAFEGSSGHEQTALFPAEQTTQLGNQPEQAVHQDLLPIPDPLVDAVQVDRSMATETSMAPDADTSQARTKQVNSDDAHFTEAQDLVDKSFSTLQADQTKPARKPVKLQLTKRKRTDTQDRARPSDNDISLFDIPQDEEAIIKPSEGAADLVPQDAEQLNTMPPGTMREDRIETTGPEQPSADTRPIVAAASPVDSVLHVTKRKKGPTVAMASCVECGNQTGKAPVGPTRCSKCRKKMKADASRLDRISPSHTSREGTLDAAVPSTKGETSVRSSIGEALPRHLIDGQVGGPQAAVPFNMQPQPDEVSRDDVHMADEIEPVHEDANSPSEIVAGVNALRDTPATGQQDEERNNSGDDVPMTDDVEEIHSDVNSLFDDVEMVDEPRRVSASGQEDEAFLQGMAEASLMPSTPGRKTGGIKRKSQRAAARDEYDLGNSFKRPKKTYQRLIGMALLSAPNYRLQGKGIVEWISNNVPDYDENNGKWANGIKATLRLNATGKSGKIICTQVDWAEGDDGEPGKDWWVLKPDVKDTLDRWDHDLQRPLSGPNASQLSGQDHLELDSDDDDDEIERQARLLDSATSSRSKKSKWVKPPGEKRARKSAALATDADAMEVDGIEDYGHQEATDVETSEEEPLASRANRKSFNSSASQERTTSLHSGLGATPSKKSQTTTGETPLGPSQRAMKDIMSLLDAPGACPVRDDLYIRELIREEVENIDFSKKNLEDWPEYHLENRFDRDQKIAEIKARPNRKQLFGKPASASVLEDPFPSMRPPPSAPTLTVLPDSEEFASIGVGVDEVEKPCNSLADFLGVQDGVEYVPCIHKAHLAYKDQNPHVRNPYMTDIRLHL